MGYNARGRKDGGSCVRTIAALVFLLAGAEAAQAATDCKLNMLGSVDIQVTPETLTLPVTFANGATNPNRIAGTTAPAAGLAVTLNSYDFVDAGKQQVDVTNDQTRFLAGLRGEALGWKWESALLYSHAEVKDVSDGISATAVQKQLGLSTSDAYNPFNGGTVGNPSVGDATPNSQAAIDAIRIKSTRDSTSSLASWDFRVSKADLFHLPGGDLSDGLAFDAVRIRLLEIGEAVKALPDDLLATQPSMLWRQIVRMRDHLANRYFDTAHAILQATVDEDLPDLEKMKLIWACPTGPPSGALDKGPGAGWPDLSPTAAPA